ncbi:MAG: hypothetical protein ACK5MU_02065 [Candidatus Saccharimonadales bacterium]
MDATKKQQATEFVELANREMETIKQATDRIVAAAGCFEGIDPEGRLSFADKFALLYANRIFDFAESMRNMSVQTPILGSSLVAVMNSPDAQAPAPKTQAEAAVLLMKIFSNEQAARALAEILFGKNR